MRKTKRKESCGLKKKSETATWSSGAREVGRKWYWQPGLSEGSIILEASFWIWNKPEGSLVMERSGDCHSRKALLTEAHPTGGFQELPCSLHLYWSYNT